jgi:hypothetical protein
VIQKLLSIVAVISLLAAVAVLWLAPPFGHFFHAYLWRQQSGKYVGVICYQNHLSMMSSLRTSPFSLGEEDPPPASHRFVRVSAVTGAFGDIPSQSFWNRLGFYDWMSMQFVLANNEQISYRQWLVPTWFVVGLLLLPGILWIRVAGVRRRRLGQESICANCGYDLRATPSRCPECGCVPGAAGVG